MANTFNREAYQKRLKQVQYAWRKSVNLPIAVQRGSLSTNVHTPDQIWVSRTELARPPEESSLLRLVFTSLEQLAEGEPLEYKKPPVANVPVEWSGPSREVKLNAPEHDVSEHEKFENINQSIHGKTTLFYVHGGGNVYGSPAISRSTVSKLVNYTGYRCLSVDYRLAPESPFPAGLLDILIAYLSLLSPPPGSLHSPIPASSIVIVADSSGMQSSMSLIQLLLAMRHQQAGFGHPTFKFNDREIPLALPAGVAGPAGLFDYLWVLPSRYTKAATDTLLEADPFLDPKLPPQPGWPSDPPRVDIYCEKSALSHPCVTPIAARTWKGSPPIYFQTGDERSMDGTKAVAQLAAREGVSVGYEEYEGMPHLWFLVMKTMPQAERAYIRWAQAAKAMANGSFKSFAQRVTLEAMDARRLDIEHLLEVEPEEVRRRVKQEQESRQPFMSAAGPKSSL